MATNSRLEDLASLVTMADDDLMLVTDVSESPAESKKITKADLAAGLISSPLTISGADPIIDIIDTDLPTIINRIRGADGILSFMADLNNQATGSFIELGLNGTRRLSLHITIAGHDLINLRLGGNINSPFGPLITNSSLVHFGTPAQVDANTSSPHGIPLTGFEGYEVKISGATPNGYNGSFEVLDVISTTRFTYRLSLTQLPAANPDGFTSVRSPQDAPPVCLIVGSDEPSTYSGLIDSVNYGSMFLKHSTTNSDANNIYSVGQDGGGAKAWKTLSAT